MDWDFLVRLRDAGARMIRLPRFLGAFRVHSDQKTNTVGLTLGVEERERTGKRLHGRSVDQGGGPAAGEAISGPPRGPRPALPTGLAQVLSNEPARLGTVWRPLPHRASATCGARRTKSHTPPAQSAIAIRIEPSSGATPNCSTRDGASGWTSQMRAW